jgi:hypothetical protein
MSKAAETTRTEPRWSVEIFAAFWQHPDPSLVPGVLTEDVVGHWPGRDDPVHGREDYTACIAALVRALPDVRVAVAEHARNGEHVFIRWILEATGRHGPFEVTGMDRVRVRDGLVAENMVVCDTAAFERRAGMPLPWAR